MITAIHHAQITIPPGAEEAARAFYCGVLGLAEIAKPESLAGRGGFWLAVGERSVHVGVEDRVEGARTRAHVAYEVNDLDFFRHRLLAARFDVIEGVPIPGHDRFELRDPFGNRLELIQPHALAKSALPPATRIEIPELLTTERLDIRQPRVETLDRDAAEVHAAVIESIDELQPWMKWATPTPTPVQTRENLRRAIDLWRMRKELRLLLFLKGTNTLVGSSGMHDLEWDIPRFEIGYWARTKFAGRGYVTEAVCAIRDLAFETLGARRVEIRTSSRNERSIRVAQRAGFGLEAVLKCDERQIDGALRDSHIYALVRDESSPVPRS